MAIMISTPKTIYAIGDTTISRASCTDRTPVPFAGELVGLKRAVLAKTANVVVNSVCAASIMVPGSSGEVGLFLLAILDTYCPNSFLSTLLVVSKHKGYWIPISKNLHIASGLNCDVFDGFGAKVLKKGTERESVVATNVPEVTL